MTKKLLIRTTIASLIFTLGLMIFTRHGSINPKEIGFYTSIGAGVLWFALMYFALKKFSSKVKDKGNTD